MRTGEWLRVEIAPPPKFDALLAREAARAEKFERGASDEVDSVS